MRNKNKLLFNQAKQRQRFSIRKLTIGTASVLLGTSLLWGAKTVRADTEAANPNNDIQTEQIKKNSNDVDNKTTYQQKDEEARQEPQAKTSAKLENTQSKLAKTDTAKLASAAKTQTLNTDAAKAAKNVTSPASLKENKTASRSTEEKPYFTGVVSIKNPDGSDVPVFNSDEGAVVHSGDQYLLKYQLSTQGGNPDTTNTKFIVLIPKGFNTNGLENDNSSSQNSYTYTSLGKTKNGELIYQVTTNKAPERNNGQVNLKALITASSASDPAIYGKHTYNVWKQLVFGEADSVISNPQYGPSYGGGNFDIELENGTKITASKNVWGIDGQQNGKINYTLMPGKRELNPNNFGVDYKVTANAQPVQGKLGQEDLNVTINFPTNQNVNDDQKVKDGDYIDFKLGIPYTDEQGNIQVKPYDTKLSRASDFLDNGQIITKSGINIGQIYNMGTYYRLVFNANTSDFYSTNPHDASLQIKLSLPWANENFSSQSIASVHWPDTYYLYQYTNDKSKNGTSFFKKLANDVNINGKTYASGLKIQGKYIYTGYLTEKNTKNEESISSNTVRSWNSQDNTVNINTQWQNINHITLALQHANDDQNVGYEFKIVTQVGKSPLINYQWKTDEEVAKEIKQIISTPKKTNLKNQVVGINSDYVTYDQTDGTKPTTEITVTHVDQNTDNQLKRIYHVVISNPDVMLKGSISTLTASASGFTLPDYIKNYSDEIAKVVTQGNYDGDDTANRELLNALINTERVNSQVIDQNGKDISLHNQDTKWTAWAIFTPTGSSVNGYFSVNDLAIAKLRFLDEDTHEQVGDILITQGGGGYKITFPTFDTILQSLKNEGYHLDYMTNQAGHRITQEQLGNFMSDNLKFTVYLTKTTDQSSYHVHYIDVTGKTLPAGQTQWQASDGHELTQHRITVSGFVGATSSAQLWNYAADGYTLVQAPNNLGTQVFNKNTPDQYVFIKRNRVTPPVVEKASYKIYYIDLGANPSKLTDLKPEDGHEISAHTITVEGKIGDKPVVTLWDYTKDHYLKVSAPENLANVAISKGMANQYVYLKHQTTDISNQKTITETIKYQYTDGSKAAENKTTSITFNQSGYRDLVTNEVHYKAWNPTSYKFKQVEIPTIDKYKVISATLNDSNQTSYLSDDKKFVKEVTVKHDSQNPIITVIFQKISSETTPVTDQKTITETIKYQYADGSQAAKDYQKTITFTRTGEKDAQGNITWNDWNKEADTFPAVSSPNISGYQADQPRIESQPVTADSKDLSFTVTYTKVNSNNPAPTPEPTNPSQPDNNPQQPTSPIEKPDKPETPLTPTVPNKQDKGPINPSKINGPSKNTQINAKAAPQTISGINKEQKAKETLPQTGESENSLGIIGLGITFLITLLGIANSKRKHN